jgi:predicted outer membrane repeat protein
LIPVLAGPLTARTWQILPDGSGDCPTIQAGIDSAAVGDTVLVGCGSYYEHDIVLKAGIVVRSADEAASCATVDAQGLGRVFVSTGLADTTRLAGFTITGGQGLPGTGYGGGGIHCTQSPLHVSHCVVTGNTSEFGGGVGCYESSLVLEKCRIEANQATGISWAAGGGMFCRESDPVLQNCDFVSNTAFGLVLPGDGGGIFSENSDLEAIDCSFQGNASGAGGGGFYSYSFDNSILTGCTFSGNRSEGGGGMYFETSYAQLNDCVFDSDSASTGGALFIALWSSPGISDCLFTGNKAEPYSGGAIACWQSSPYILGSTFLENSAGLDGGAMICNSTCLATIRDCRFIGNTAGRSGGAIRSFDATQVDVATSTLTGNSASVLGGGISTELSGPLIIKQTIVAFSALGEGVACTASDNVTVSCSDIYGNAGGNWVGCLTDQLVSNENIEADPMFCDPGNDNYFVRTNSPCLPQYNACGLLMGAHGSGCGPGLSAGSSVEPSSWGKVKARYRR